MPLVVSSFPRDGVMQITLSRPEARNALSASLLGELGDTVNEAINDSQVRCIVLTGGDQVFSAGADIKEMAANGMAALEDVTRCRGWAIVEHCPKPVIASVSGYAFGGGNELAMLADFIIASDKTKFGQPEINLGIFPGDGGTQRLTRLVGRALAMKMILTGQPIDAPTALRAGLVAEIHPANEVLQRSLDIAEIIAGRAPIALRLAKDAVKAVDEISLSAGVTYERRLIAFAFTTSDQKEGMKAFIEKRQAKFTGC